MTPLPFFLVSLAFMPYMPGGLRVEHLIFPLLFVFQFVYFVFNLRRISPFMQCVSLLFLILSFAAFTTLVGSFLSDNTGAYAEPASMFVRLCMPALMLFTFASICERSNLSLSSIAEAILVVSMFVGIISILSVFFDILYFIEPFVHSGEGSVWAASKDIGRNLGIFNQPLEAGVFFTAALLSLVYLTKIKFKTAVPRLIYFGIILFAGSLTYSKNFYMVGIFVSIIYSFSIGLVGPGRILLYCVFFIPLFFAVLLNTNPDYISSLVDLYDDGGLLLALTAGRIGSDQTTVSQLFGELFANDLWFFGNGLGSFLPLDNGYLEYFFQGGIFSLLSYVAFVCVILVIAFRNRYTDEAKLLLCMIIFIILASIGGPVITANRASVSFMLLLTSALFSLYKNPHSTN